MKTKLTYFAILLVLLATTCMLVLRVTSSTPLGSKNSEFSLGNGMPQNLMTPPQHSEADFNEIMGLVAASIGEDWLASGSPHHLVRTNDLIEVAESDGDYVLSMQLFRQDLHLATENRFFVSFLGPDGEIEDRPLTILACAMFSNGFLSGSCELTEVSSTSVSVEQDLLHINPRGANWLVIGSTFLAFGSVFAVLFGHGRGRIADRAVVMYRRNFSFDSGNAPDRSDEQSGQREPPMTRVLKS